MTRSNKQHVSISVSFSRSIVFLLASPFSFSLCLLYLSIYLSIIFYDVFSRALFPRRSRCLSFWRESRRGFRPGSTVPPRYESFVDSSKVILHFFRENDLSNFHAVSRLFSLSFHFETIESHEEGSIATARENKEGKQKRKVSTMSNRRGTTLLQKTKRKKTKKLKRKRRETKPAGFSRAFYISRTIQVHRSATFLGVLLFLDRFIETISRHG